jgi:uncharacterized protein YbjQ (UPF0145 family)
MSADEDTQRLEDMRLVTAQLGAQGVLTFGFVSRFMFADGSYIDALTVDRAAWRALIAMANRAATAHACAVCGQTWPCAGHHDAWFDPTQRSTTS